MTKVYINASSSDKADAKVSVYDHGLLYGDGVFEVCASITARCFASRNTTSRLYESARHICLEVPLTREQLSDASFPRFRPTVKKTAISGSSSPAGRRSGARSAQDEATADHRHCGRHTMYPPELYENGMEIVTAETIRNHPNALIHASSR